MSLPDTYTVKAGAIPDYFEAILNAEAPERFSHKFLVGLDFKSTNDRLFIGILKELGFIDTDGVPTPRYFEFLDRSQSPRILASGIREAYSDLFAVNKEAYKLSADEVKNKLRTLYAGSKKDGLIGRIATTFVALCDYADFTGPSTKNDEPVKKDKIEEKPDQKDDIQRAKDKKSKSVNLDSLQYHINIVLPEAKDQAVYDAIFKSLRDHLG
ncbi:DUF5343 domain-containing protein [Sneathiella sp.]|uniref:DUF5343 domain-containing protein n=1 Tax=Sneathiella sp. TaxID=1964365 RepID=UPI00262550C4|nr:DUF5343 domain-containing protein [Sneathiella sp.]MDF2366488.1 DUF5343 domain-containing protein [Sneathiella sp.]